MKKSIKYIIIAASLCMWGVVIIIIVNLSQVESIDPVQLSKNYLERYDLEYDYTTSLETFNDRDTVWYVTDQSQDSNFSIVFDNGRYHHDTYFDDVVSGRNTFRRISDEYYSEYLSHEVREQEIQGYFYNSDIIADPLEYKFPNFGDMVLEIGDLELDKQYDIKELGNTYTIIYYFDNTTTVDAKYTADLLIKKKDELDTLNIPYRAIVIHVGVYSIGVKKEDIKEDTLIEYIQSTYNIE